MIVRASKGAVLVLLALSTIMTGLPSLAGATSSQTSSGQNAVAGGDGLSSSLNTVGADPVPNLSLPRAEVSGVDDLTSGGLIENSRQNLTLYNLGVSLQLLGGAVPRDQLVASSGTMNSSVFWRVEANLNGLWIPLVPLTSSFQILGTNTTGSFVIRTMQVAGGAYSGQFRMIYRATSAGPMKWDLEFTPTLTGIYRLVYDWTNITDSHSLSTSLRQIEVVYKQRNYTFFWNDVPGSYNTTVILSGNSFSLYATIGTVYSGSTILVDPGLVGYLNPGTTEATAYTFQRKVFHDPVGDNYWLFYYDGYSLVQRYSQDGKTWLTPSGSNGMMPLGWPRYYDAPTSSPSVLNLGQTVIVASGSQAPFQVGGGAEAKVYYAVGTISGSSLSWQVDPQTSSATRVAATMRRACHLTNFLCNITMITRYVTIGQSPNGSIAFSFNLYGKGDGPGLCNWSWQEESDLIVAVLGRAYILDCANGPSSLRSIVLPSNSETGLRIVYQFPSASGLELRSRTVTVSAPIVQTVTPDMDSKVSYEYPTSKFGHNYTLTVFANHNGVFNLGEPVVYDVDSNGIFNTGDYVIAGTTPYPSAALTIDQNIKFVDNNNNNLRDSGEPVAYDADNSGTFTTGDALIMGPAPAAGAPLKTDSKVKFMDTNNDNSFVYGEPVVYDQDNGGYFNNGDTVIAGTTPVTGIGLNLDQKIKFLDTNNNNVRDSGEPVVYDLNNDGYFTTDDAVIAGITYSDYLKSDPKLKFVDSAYNILYFSLIHFSLPPVPAEGSFTSSNVTLNVEYCNPYGPCQLQLSMTTGSWGESTVTWNNAPHVIPTNSPSVASQLTVGSRAVDTSDIVRAMYSAFTNSTILVLPVQNAYLDISSRETATPPTLRIFYNCCLGNRETISSNIEDSGQFSAVYDSDNGVHVVFKNNGKITYWYRSASSSAWSDPEDVFPIASSPTITIDSATNDVYVFAYQGTSILMKKKTGVQKWADNQAVACVTNANSLNHLGSNLVSTGGTSSGMISLVWTEGSSKVWHASIPVQTVWSPYSSPSDPWDGNGIAPFGKYFANLGMYVSPSTGMLTVKQTDLSVPGRGIDLEMTRVYTEPQSFINGPQGYAPYQYESYQWAPLGNAWQLNFPWMTNAAKPPYIHLWDGQGYRIPDSFWNASVSSTSFENHQGDHFRLIRNSTGVFLFTKSGTIYSFDSNHGNRLSKISDPTDPSGTNTIVFGYYNNNLISSITDSLQRLFLFCYSASTGLLSRIDQAGGNCDNETNRVRSISFRQTGTQLTSEIDPAGRITSYEYDSTGWLLLRINYPTKWYSQFTYSSSLTGTELSVYRVYREFVNASSVTPIRLFEFNYTQGVGEQISNSTVRVYNGTSPQPVSYTTYAFSFAGITWNVSDTNHNLVTGMQQIFGVHGEALNETVILTDGGSPPKLGSYTNRYRYDLWGNLIYSRKSINPATNWYHEKFSSYFNDGLPVGFNTFQESFGQGNFTSTDNTWSIQSGNWKVKNGALNGTWTNGPEASTFAWTDIGKKDMILQSRVYVGKFVDTYSKGLDPQRTDSRVGMFLHYPGNGASKWSLAFRFDPQLWASSGNYYFELSDDGGAGWLGNSQPAARTACHLTLGIWYTFTLTVHGYQATGSVAGDGQTACSAVSANFPSGSPSASGTGFGLYAGGFSARFDNITVATVSPPLTGTGFSNSFQSNMPPSQYIHGAIAGVAEFQNGTATGSPVPIETYYSYYAWGGLNQVRQLYSSSACSCPQWLTTSRTYDTYGNLGTLVDPRGNSTNYTYSSTYHSAYLTAQSQSLVPATSPTQLVTRYSYNSTTGSLLSTVDPRGFNSTYQYDILGRLTKVNYPNTDYESYSYNDTANFVDVTNENGWKTRQIYDGLGRLSKVDRFNGATSYSNETYTYNWDDKISTDTDPLTNKYVYQYDPVGRQVKLTKPDLNFTSQYFDDLHSRTRSVDEFGVSKCSVHDRLGRLVEVLENASSDCLLGQVTDHYRDEMGNLVKTVSSDYRMANPGFETGDFRGWTQSGLSGLTLTNNSHSGSYGATSYIQSTCLTNYSLQQNLPTPIPGYLIASIQLWYYGGRGNDVVRVTYSDESYTETTLASVVAWTLKVLAFDSSKQITGIQVQNTSTVCTGGPVTLDDFSINTTIPPTTYVYDNVNRLTRIGYPDNTSESFNYDNQGNLVKKVDRKGGQVNFTYDSLNRLLSTGYGDSYQYDYNGNLLNINSQNTTLSHNYDSRNRVTSEYYMVNTNEGGGGSVAYGTLITMASGLRKPVQNLEIGEKMLGYDLQKKTFTVSTVIDLKIVDTPNMLVINTETGIPFRVDANPLQTLWTRRADGSQDWVSVTEIRVGDFLFSEQGRWVRVTGIEFAPQGKHVMFDIIATAPYFASGYLDPQVKRHPPGPSSTILLGGSGVSSSYFLSYSYSGELLDTMGYADYLGAKYSYDGLGRVLSVSKSGTSTVYAKFTYFPNDRLRGIEYGNGLVANYTYNALSNPSSAILKDPTSPTNPPNNQILLSLNYLYNKTSTIASITGWTRNTQGNQVTLNEQYRYDPLMRITNTTVNAGSSSTSLWYDYSSTGSRRTQGFRQGTTGPWTITSYTYNATNNALKSSTDGVTYSYDANGNQVSRGAGSDIWAYTWDMPGNLLKVTKNSIVQARYAYDALGRRVESVESSTMFYAYLGTQTVYERTSAGTSSDYVYGAGLKIAKVSGATVNYYHNDHLGSTRLVTSSTKSVVFSDNYQPFGQDNSPSGSETYKFTGKGWSSASQLYYYFQRWYDPSTGRFVSRDPVPGSTRNPQSSNSYAYALNLPTLLTDPSGETSESGSECGIGQPSSTGCVGSLGGLASIEAEYTLTATEELSAGEAGSIRSLEGIFPSELVDIEAGQGFQVGTNVVLRNPNAIRFTQLKASLRFSEPGRGTILELAEDLRTGKVNPGSFESPIRVVEINDKLYSLDNRRLVAFQMAGEDIPTIRVPLSGEYLQTFKEHYEESVYEGLRIFVRGFGWWSP